MKKWVRFFKDKQGFTAIEYGLIAALPLSLERRLKIRERKNDNYRSC